MKTCDSCGVRTTDRIVMEIRPVGKPRRRRAFRACPGCQDRVFDKLHRLLGSACVECRTRPGWVSFLRVRGRTTHLFGFGACVHEQISLLASLRRQTVGEVEAELQVEIRREAAAGPPAGPERN
jgi:hypothetical protein